MEGAIPQADQTDTLPLRDSCERTRFVVHYDLVTIKEAENVLGRLFEPRFLAIIGCWFIASAVVDYETPKSFNFVCSLAALAPFAAVWAQRVWVSRVRGIQSTPSSQR